MAYRTALRRVAEACGTAARVEVAARSVPRAAGPGWRVELPQRGYASAVLVIFSSCLVEAACLACALDHHVLRLPQPAYSLPRKVDSRV